MGDRTSNFRAIRRKRNFIHKKMLEDISQFHERVDRDKKNEYRRKNYTLKNQYLDEESIESDNG